MHPFLGKSLLRKTITEEHGSYDGNGQTGLGDGTGWSEEGVQTSPFLIADGDGESFHVFKSVERRAPQPQKMFSTSVRENGTGRFSKVICFI